MVLLTRSFVWFHTPDYEKSFFYWIFVEKAWIHHYIKFDQNPDRPNIEGEWSKWAKWVQRSRVLWSEWEKWAVLVNKCRKQPSGPLKNAVICDQNSGILEPHPCMFYKSQSQNMISFHKHFLIPLIVTSLQRINTSTATTITSTWPFTTRNTTASTTITNPSICQASFAPCLKTAFPTKSTRGNLPWANRGLTNWGLWLNEQVQHWNL